MAVINVSHGLILEGNAMAEINIRKGMPSVQLDKAEFKKRFLTQFYDPAFQPLQKELDKIAEAAWDGYYNYRKAPHTVKAGQGFTDPDYDLSVEWLETSKAIAAAERRQKEAATPSRVLIVNGSTRSEHTCPGEMSKTFRMVSIARDIVAATDDFEAEVLDLSRLASEYGRTIYPCKACVSTAEPLCHWPCSCYPNHAIGQTGDWMNEIYPMWAAAHGVMIVCPVNWYQAPSSLKLMIDRWSAPTAAIRTQPRPMARMQPRRKNSNLKAGPTRAISPAAYSRSSCMATPPAPRTCGAFSATG